MAQNSFLQQNPGQPSQEQPRENLGAGNTVFHTIIDVFAQVMQGNFVPALAALRHGYIDIDYRDQYGFSLLHYCVTKQVLDLAIYLLDQGAQVDIRSLTNQTPLMIACDTSSYEMCKLLISRGANINLRDNYKFTPLLYAVKSNSLPLFFYLIALGADVNATDSNNSGVQHWSAYNNSVKILQFAQQVGLDLELMDSQGYTPIERAIQNFAYESIHLLAFKNPKHLLRYELVFSAEELDPKSTKKQIVVTSQSVRKIIFDAIDTLPEVRAKKFKILSPQQILFLQQNWNKVIFALTSTLSLLLDYCYFSSDYAKSQDFSITSIVFFILSIYYLLLIYYFIFKIPCATDNSYSSRELLIVQDRSQLMREEQESEKKQRFMHLLDPDFIRSKKFPHLDYILQKIYPDVPDLSDLSSNSFLKEIALLWEANRFKNLKCYEFERVCMVCMKFKEEKTEHCPVKNTCVRFYSHYSSLYQKCISSKNHLFYMAIVLSQQGILFWYIITQVLHYLDRLTSYKIFCLIETPFLVFQTDGSLHLFLLITTYLLFFYNSINTCIEIYGIIHDRTRNEIFYPNRYRYLYEVVQNDEGRILLKRLGPFHLGIVQNITNYLQRSILHLKSK